MNKPCLLLLCAALAGCSFVPEYLRPAFPVATSWPKSEGQEMKDGREAASLDWKTYFLDARLQDLIATALTHNRDVRMAAARIEEARAQYGVVRADRLPNVNLATSGAASHVPADLSSSGREMTTRRYDFGVSLLSFELDFWGRVKSLNEAARQSLLASEESARLVRLSLIAEVANAYFGLLEMNERTLVASETLRSREETRTMIAKRREVGLAADVDYLQADGAYQLARAELANLERQRAAADNALTLLIGTTPAALPAGRKLSEQGIVADLAPGLPSEVLQKRPDVQAAEKRLLAANANIGAARAAFLPRIALTGMLGTASKGLTGLFESGSGAWSFQPSLSLPLFDAGRVASGVDLAEARKVLAVAEYEKTIQSAFREVADLLAARTQLRNQLEAQQVAEQSQTQVLRLAKARYEAGITSYLEVLDAERSLYAARQMTLQTQRAQWTTAAQLYKALGGGQ